LCVCGIEADKAANKCQCGGRNEFHVISPLCVARRIKADAALCSIPIIAVTSYALSGKEKTARAAGCDDYVPKPFSPRQLLSKICQYLQ